MTVIKITACVFISLGLFGCDNSEKTKENEEEKLTQTQDMIISEAKKSLPYQVDLVTTLVDVFKDDNSINYRYSIKVSKNQLHMSETEKLTTENLKNIYCTDNQQIKEFRDAFPNGAVHNYYINNEKIFSIKLTPDSCNVN
ncbi:hypothetical protein J3U21_10095 [Gilliamella sp. B2776]|uniref:hypothetical protein n=1 Tax=unclassified Gilliamella TaxID=2685620 RepID=UPI00226A77E6|nr:MULTISPECIES: hypothetical protein [unclassified Gilliamella]MCX8650633.1 hypothetical protein [Gilliamella sp. B2779]MCX8654412.1 hypothetical protein [Gilliamella sp. B2737]MCX8657009.1 hypothetical protein [Gilliamella sp. B2894]MCX8665728.1 hypothetical protein [Gilliamella sp. B2887]MCX8692502.1 hypothetical protein [Gilliamella sp. B2776]